MTKQGLIADSFVTTISFPDTPACMDRVEVRTSDGSTLEIAACHLQVLRKYIKQRGHCWIVQERAVLSEEFPLTRHKLATHHSP
jgi:hypothetical protein